MATLVAALDGGLAAVAQLAWEQRRAAGIGADKPQLRTAGSSWKMTGSQHIGTDVAGTAAERSSTNENYAKNREIAAIQQRLEILELAAAERNGLSRGQSVAMPACVGKTPLGRRTVAGIQAHSAAEA